MPPQRGTDFWRTLAQTDARQAGIDARLFARQINQESGFNPTAHSGAGAQGIAQIMPNYHPEVNPNDPYAALKWAAHYMAGLVHKYGSYQKALSVYNSGQPNTYLDPNFAGGQTYNYVRSIMGGQNPSVANPRVTPAIQGTTAVPVPTENPSKQRGLALLQGLLKDQPIPDILKSINSAQSPSLSAPGMPASFINKAPKQQKAGKFSVGDPVIDGTSIGGEHPTAGLDGYPARDYFAPAGTGVVAPVTGKVIKLSGHPPAEGPIEGPHGPLGWSVYIQGQDGRIYYMTHMGSRTVKLGQTVKAGTPIGTVANYDKYGTPSHIHMGVHG